MKVLLVYKDYYPPVCGGIERHINLLANGLKHRGIQVEVLVSNTEPALVRENINGIVVTKVPELGRLASAPLNATFPFWLKRLGQEADVLHFHLPNPTAVMSYLISGLNNNVTITYHSDIVKQAKLGKLYSPFLLKFLRKARAIIATSPHYVRSSRVLPKFHSKCEVIPLGIDLSMFVSRPEGDGEIDTLRRIYGPSILLFIGKFRYYKGLHILIEAMNRVRGKLLLIGTGPLEKDLLSQVAAAKLEKKIFFLGELSDQKMLTYLQACDILVLPSHLRSEAFGLVQTEAMACGKPVVCTELGTGTSFVNQHQETGLVVPPNDVDALGRAINFLLDNHEIRKKYGEAGLERAKIFFSNERMVDNIIAVYRNS